MLSVSRVLRFCQVCLPRSDNVNMWLTFQWWWLCYAMLYTMHKMYFLLYTLSPASMVKNNQCIPQKKVNMTCGWLQPWFVCCCFIFWGATIKSQQLWQQFIYQYRYACNLSSQFNKFLFVHGARKTVHRLTKFIICKYKKQWTNVQMYKRRIRYLHVWKRLESVCVKKWP